MFDILIGTILYIISFFFTRTYGPVLFASPNDVYTNADYGSSSLIGILTILIPVSIFIVLSIISRKKSKLLLKSSFVSISIKFTAIILALILSSITLTKTTVKAPTFGRGGPLSCPPQYEYRGLKGLPIPYQYFNTDVGGYKDNFILFSINYWIMILLLSLTVEFLTTPDFLKSKNKIIAYLKNNVVFLVFSMGAYILNLLASVFFGVQIIC